MRARLLLALSVLVPTLAVGCGPISYAQSPQRIDGRTVYVEMPTIAVPDQRIDAAKTCQEIHDLAIDYLKRYGYEPASDPSMASLTLRAEIANFHLGSTAARVWVGAGQSWHETTIVIRPRGLSENTGYRRAEVAAGAYSNYKGDEAHRVAVCHEIAKMHVWIADKYIGR